ncbi:NAD(P)-dependent oxidoreductase [Candidatus Bathyarchaeota archaeon]|nr:NAD(P)-dependent oxidoreductase [Candidatus Bathyarchaeota archaeon]
MAKQRVFLAGASGSMGFEAFKHLWERRDEFDLVLLQRPSNKNKKLFKKYEKKSGITCIPGNGVVECAGLKIVWGDATNHDDVVEACSDVDWVLCPMAFISPAADRNPTLAARVNTGAIKSIVRAIEARDGGAEHVKLILIGSVAETGDRLPPIHHGRIGDPMKPSMFDFYATTKIRGERIVMESDIKHWATLRQTFIMIPDIMSLQDPIMFHQPINSFMENNTARDAGRGLINCLDIPDDSDFWRRTYNMGGGPSCRITYLEFLDGMFSMLGLNYKNIMERKWFALRNFHMQYFDDSHVLNEYINNWGDSMADFFKMAWDNLPKGLKFVARLCQRFKRFRKLVERATRKRLIKMARCADGTLGWYENNNEMRLTAFYGSREAFESIPGWDENMPQLDPEPEWHRLDHGYDEGKEMLDLEDLQGAARYRGGQLLSATWSGDMFETLAWECAFGHEFEAKPNTILKGGIWCPECLPPPWNFGEIAKQNQFFAQVWYPNHGVDEMNCYPADCYKDIEGLKD